MQVRPLFELLFRFLALAEIALSSREAASGVDASGVVSSCNTRATLNTVSEEVWNEQFEELRTKASDLLNQLNILRDRITTAVNGNHLQNLLQAVEECLTLKADQDDLVKLKQDLIDREAVNREVTPPRPPLQMPKPKFPRP